MPTTPDDDRSLESPKIRLWVTQFVIECGDFSLKNQFRLVSFRGKRVQGVRKTVVERGQSSDAFPRDGIYACIVWRRRHFLFNSCILW